MPNLRSYLIKSDLPISGVHWGIEFKAGVAATEDAALANKLIRKGYTVTCVSEPKEQPAPAPPAAPAEPEKTEEPEQPVADEITVELNVKTLRAIGKEHGLSFPVGTTKQAMADAINEAKAKE